MSDYFSVAFLHTLHGVAGTRAEAAGLALRAGIDVELPTVDCYGDPLLAALAERDASTSAGSTGPCERVLTQKCELGLLDPDWSAGDPDRPLRRAPVTASTSRSESRSLARDVARRSIVLLANQGTLPLAPGQRIAVVGPRRTTRPARCSAATRSRSTSACTTPACRWASRCRPCWTRCAADPAGYTVSYAQGCPVLGGDDAGLAAAAAAASAADVCVAVLGDLAGLFGRGTSGEGCDAADLRLPGRQEELLEALLATGTPVVLVLLAGRPYDLSRQVDRLAAAVCGFYPGEEGAPALADVLSGRVNPSGRLPVSFPGAGSTQPGTYLAAPLGQRSQVSTVDPTPLFPFGHGLSYAPVTWAGRQVLLAASGRPTAAARSR